jgi:hypothetical protein
MGTACIFINYCEKKITARAWQIYNMVDEVGSRRVLLHMIDDGIGAWLKAIDEVDSAWVLLQ